MSAGVELTRERVGIATITLNAPERRNALTRASSRALSAVCDEIDADPSIGAVVLRGTGGYFCAGGDRTMLAEAGRCPASAEAFSTMTDVYSSFRRIGRLQAPTIAAVRGGAVGAGLNLALAADLRVVSREARLLSGFMRIGLLPGGGHGHLISAAGPEAAAALSLFGEAIDGCRAVELGLAWEAVDDDQVDSRAYELAAVPAQDPELARRTARNIRLQIARPASWDVALELERAGQMWSMQRASAP